jgi:hypothetical protein
MSLQLILRKHVVDLRNSAVLVWHADCSIFWQAATRSVGKPKGLEQLRLEEAVPSRRWWRFEPAAGETGTAPGRDISTATTFAPSTPRDSAGFPLVARADRPSARGLESPRTLILLGAPPADLPKKAAFGRPFFICMLQKKGTGPVVRSTLRAVPATGPVPFFWSFLESHAQIVSVRSRPTISHCPRTLPPSTT